MIIILIRDHLFTLSNGKSTFFDYYYHICLPWLLHSNSAYHGHVIEVLENEAWFAHKPNQSELQLDQSQLSYPKHLGPVQQKAAQPNIAKRPTTFKLATSLGSWEADKDRSPCKQMTQDPGRHETWAPCPHKQNLGQQCLTNSNLTKQKVLTKWGWTPTIAKNPHWQCQRLHWGVLVTAALALANDGRNLSAENKRNKEEKEIAWPGACGKQRGDTSRRCPVECRTTFHHYGRSSGPPGTREG